MKRARPKKQPKARVKKQPKARVKKQPKARVKKQPKARVKKQPKAAAKTKIIGKLSRFNAQHITLQTAKGVVWKIAKAPNTKVTGALKLGSNVTVEFSKKNGRQFKPRPIPPHQKPMGRRTEEVGG